MRHRRPRRPKKPYVATMDQVRISRDEHGAIIEYAEENVSTTHLVLDPNKMARMTDEDVLELHNDCIERQQALADSYEWIATEIQPGRPQVKRDRRSGHPRSTWGRPTLPHHGLRIRRTGSRRDLHRRPGVHAPRVRRDPPDVRRVGDASRVCAR